MASSSSSSAPSATTFRLSQPPYNYLLKSKPPPSHISFKPYTFSPITKLQFSAKSTNVSKEDIPPSFDPVSSQPPADTDASETTATTDDDALDTRKGLQEKFAVLNTGIYECRSCGYLCNEAAGDPSYPIPPGLPFNRFPDDWRCPTCGAAKSFFVSKSVEIAGFAQNQQFGLGGNTLTSGQKAILIYGSLLFFFVLFLSGYFLQ